MRPYVASMVTLETTKLINSVSTGFALWTPFIFLAAVTAVNRDVAFERTFTDYQRVPHHYRDGFTTLFAVQFLFRLRH